MYINGVLPPKSFETTALPSSSLYDLNNKSSSAIVGSVLVKICLSNAIYLFLYLLNAVGLREILPLAIWIFLSPGFNILGGAATLDPFAFFSAFALRYSTLFISFSVSLLVSKNCALILLSSGTSNPTLFFGLDTTPHYAFSVSECLSVYAVQATKFITIRRSSDSATADFNWGEFIGGDAEAWVGANDGFIVWLFDHSGNGRPYSTNSSGVQPKIISSGSLITDGSGNVVVESAAGQALYTFTDGTQGQLTSGSNTGLLGSAGALFTAVESTDTNYTIHGESGFENGSAKVIQSSAIPPEQFLGTPTYKVDAVTASPVTAGQLYTMMNGAMKVLSITNAAWSTNAVWNTYNRPHMATNFGSGFVGTVGCQIVFNDAPTANDITEIETHLMARY